MADWHGQVLFESMRQLARLAALYHRAVLEGAENLPEGPALLVGNHGLFGLETPVFFYLLHHRTGRLPYGLADRRLFGAPAIAEPFRHLGGVVGTRENALALLRRRHHVVCYPGGSREVFKSPEQRYRLQWRRALGFARIALEARVPVVPFAGLGVDDTFVNLGHLPLVRSALGRYAVPLAFGLGALPLPVRIRFRLAPPLRPERFADPAALKDAVQREVEGLLGHVATPPDAAAPVH